MGLESGDPLILKNIKKGATVEEEGHPLPHVEMPGLTRKDMVAAVNRFYVETDSVTCDGVTRSRMLKSSRNCHPEKLKATKDPVGTWFYKCRDSSASRSLP